MKCLRLQKTVHPLKNTTEFNNISLVKTIYHGLYSSFDLDPKVWNMFAVEYK